MLYVTCIYMYRRSNGMCYRLDNSRFLFPNSILFILLQSKWLIIRLSAKPNINELMLMFTNGGMLANKKLHILENGVHCDHENCKKNLQKLN